eukprot:4994938-Pleurochrysis_carterae.AAC.1
MPCGSAEGERANNMDRQPKLSHAHVWQSAHTDMFMSLPLSHTRRAGGRGRGGVGRAIARQEATRKQDKRQRELAAMRKKRAGPLRAGPLRVSSSCHSEAARAAASFAPLQESHESSEGGRISPPTRQAARQTPADVSTTDRNAQFQIDSQQFASAEERRSTHQHTETDLFSVCVRPARSGLWLFGHFYWGLHILSGLNASVRRADALSFLLSHCYAFACTPSLTSSSSSCGP